MFKRLLSLGLATILCSSMLSITAVAEKTKIEKHNHMYEFPFKCEFWIERPNNLGSYFKELDMSCGVDIDEYGKITYTYYSMEDFQFNEAIERAYSNLISIPVSYDLPEWYDCKYYDQQYFWVTATEFETNRIISDKKQIGYASTGSNSYLGISHDSSFTEDDINPNNHVDNEFYNVAFNTKYYNDSTILKLINDNTNYSVYTEYFDGYHTQYNHTYNKGINIAKDDIIAKTTISPVSRIFKDEQGDMFIRDGEEKNYFMDDVSVTVNGHKVSRTIGTVKAKHNVVASIEGDVNCDGEVNITDVVLLQKWLLAVPDIHLENWQAVDLCKDNRLDVFDLCLLKRKLIEQHNN